MVMKRWMRLGITLDIIIILIGILFFLGVFSTSPHNSTGKTTLEITSKGIPAIETTKTAVCGNGILETGELCDYAANDSVNNPYGSQCSSNCWVNGAVPYWLGCRGSGVHVCTDNPNVTNQYFIDHPLCIKATTCGGEFFNCNGIICPPPTATEMNSK